MLKKILAALDLDAEESGIYLHLLKSGSMTAGELARKLGIARPTLYGLLRRLRDRGIVTQSMARGVRNFSAAEPRKLDQILQVRIRDLQDRQKQLHAMIPALERQRAGKTVKPRFHYFDGVDGVRQVMMDMLLYRDLKTYSFWSIKAAVDLLTPEFFRFHNTERIRNRLHVEAIWPARQTVKIARFPFLGGGEGFFREIRIAPPDIEASMGYWIYGEKVAFLSSLRECYGFIIESAELAAMMQKHHQVMWALSTPFAIDPAEVRGFLAGL